MFLFTVTKPGLRQTGALALCAACLCGTVAAAVRFSGQSVPTAAVTDLSSAAVDKVKIPRKWDDSFAAFDGVVQESGLTLADCKGKTVEKWTLLCPQLSTEGHDTYCVLLVYKAKPVGAYLLQKPGGEVSGLVTTAETMADAARDEPVQETAAVPDAADFPTE